MDLLHLIEIKKTVEYNKNITYEQTVFYISFVKSSDLI